MLPDLPLDGPDVYRPLNPVPHKAKAWYDNIRKNLGSQLVINLSKCHIFAPFDITPYISLEISAF